jgi:hypothetical protein
MNRLLLVLAALMLFQLPGQARTQAECQRYVADRYPPGVTLPMSRDQLIKTCMTGTQEEMFDICMKRQAAKGMDLTRAGRECRR